MTDTRPQWIPRFLGFVGELWPFFFAETKGVVVGWEQ
jgi:hypothetical protein